MKLVRHLVLLLTAGIIVGMQYDFTFMPHDVQKPIIEVQQAMVEEFSSNRLVFKKGPDTYVWKDKKKLFKNDAEIGLYPLVYYRRSHDIEFVEQCRQSR